MRHAGRCGDSAVAVSPTTSRKVITRLISSGSSTSIGDGGMVANRSLPISQTARIGTSTRPTPSMAAVTVRSRWPGSAASPRPKRRRRKRPPAHSSTVRMAQPPRPARSRPSNCRPAPSHALVAVDSVCSEVPSSGPSLLQTSRDRGEASRRNSVRSMTSPRSLVRRSMSWSARAITTSHCLTRPSLTAACSVSRSRSAFTASDSGTASLAGLASSGARSLRVSARSPRARLAAAAAAARTSPACSRRASISTGSRLACSARVAMRSSWRVHSSTSWPNGRCGGAAVWANAGPAATSSRRSHARRMGKRTQASLFSPGLPRGRRSVLPASGGQI